MESYQYESAPGDIVVFPNGELGIITGWDVFHWKVVYVYPLFAGWLKRLLWRLTNRYEYVDSEINELVRIGKIEIKSRDYLNSFIIPDIWLARAIAERELDRFLGLPIEEDFRELERIST